MPINRDFDAELGLLSDLKSLTSAYEEISLMRIGKVRSQVIATRSFREGLFGVFSEIRASRRAEIEKILLKPKSSAKNSPPVGSKVALLISSNERLSGSISTEVTRRFTEYVKTHKDAVAIVGRVGRDYFAATQPDLKYTYFEMPENDTSMTTHAELVAFLRMYNQVSIFYGKSLL